MRMLDETQSQAGGTSEELAVRVHPATPERWPDLVTVMGIRGDPASCWCQFFRLRGQAWRDSSTATKKAALRRQVSSAPPPGVIAYRADEPVGWCAAGPKSNYPRLLASRTSRDVVTGGDTITGVWAVSCFVVRVGHRRQGIARALLAGAVDLARAHDASAVEAYPIDPTARRSVSAAELFHGPVSLFLSEGFTEVSRPSPARAIVRLDL